jgi:glycosyltransferase involved in cell wall biosynthesis
MENDTSYGNRPTDGLTWRQRLLKEVGERMDLSRVHFLGKLPFDAHLRVLQLSRAHVYLTYPYFVSWSMLEAMSAGCVVIGSSTPPVTEFIEDGKTGLLVDFFDITGLANRVCEALAEPRCFDSLRENARKLITERYDRDSICVPALLKMFEG